MSSNRTHTLRRITTLAGVSLLFVGGVLDALAANPAAGADYGLSAETTFALKSGPEGDGILFLDVRDPVEIMFTGFTALVDANIPFQTVDTTRLNAGGTGFAMRLNPEFGQQVAAALAARGLRPEEARVITLCRTGSARGEPSARYLRENGFPRSFYVIHGFEGDPVEEGPKRGMRLVNGWKNAGLPWSLGFDAAKIQRAQP